jgi:hypothetical protein
MPAAKAPRGLDAHAYAAWHAARCGAALVMFTFSACAKEAATVNTLPGSRIVVSHTFNW